jgi:hypothetical protein
VAGQKLGLPVLGELHQEQGGFVAIGLG